MPSERWSDGAIFHWRTRKPIRKLFFQTIAQFTHCLKFPWPSYSVSTQLLSKFKKFIIPQILLMPFVSNPPPSVPKIVEVIMSYRSFKTRLLKNVYEKKSVMYKSHVQLFRSSFFLRPLVDLSSCRDARFVPLPDASPWLIIDPDHRCDSATHAAVLALHRVLDKWSIRIIK